MRLVFAALVFSFAAVGFATADDVADAKRQVELDQLFGKLKSPAEADELRAAQSRIWAMWMQSGSITQDLILQQATAAMIAAEYYTSESMLNTLIERSPHDAEPYNKRAELYFLMGRLEPALQSADLALEREPRHFGAMAGRGLILQWLGREREALVAYREALAINPNLKGVEAAAKLLEKQAPSL